jgi:trans-aconitate 3-methyltransferase
VGQVGTVEYRSQSAYDSNLEEGQATAELTRFKHVIGVDPSEKMVNGARQYTTALGVTNCEFVKSSAEDLSFLEDGSVDLVVAG